MKKMLPYLNQPSNLQSQTSLVWTLMILTFFLIVIIKALMVFIKVLQRVSLLGCLLLLSTRKASQVSSSPSLSVVEATKTRNRRKSCWTRPKWSNLSFSFLKKFSWIRLTMPLSQLRQDRRRNQLSQCKFKEKSTCPRTHTKSSSSKPCKKMKIKCWPLWDRAKE